MKGVAALPFEVALVIALAGCGAGHASPSATVTVTASPQVTSAASPAPSSGSAPTNERLFADGMAASIPVIPAHVVTGVPMRAYARFEHGFGSAWSAVGQPNPSESVNQIKRGFKLCWPDTGSGSGCDTFTQFTTDHSGG
jgi:hypothetical protein